MSWLCEFVGDPDFFVSKLKTKLGNDGLSIYPEQRDAILKIFKEIQVNLTSLRPTFIDWTQVEEKLGQILLQYDSAESDELKFWITSTTWHKVFRTHERSIPELIRNSLFEMCKEIEEIGYQGIYISYKPIKAIIRRYQTLGHVVLDMEIVDWEDIRKSLWQILVDLKREFGHQGITVEGLDGKQHFIYHKLTFGYDLDYIILHVAKKTGISTEEFVLVYGHTLIDPENLDYLNIPQGAKLQLLPLVKGQKPPTNLTSFVRGIFDELYVKIDRLFKNFPKVFEDTTRLLSERDFVTISQLIGKGWDMLGIELGLSNVKLQQIIEDKRNVASRIFEMLCQWGQTRKDGATAAQLLSAIKKSDVSCDFDKLQRTLLIGV